MADRRAHYGVDFAAALVVHAAAFILSALVAAFGAQIVSTSVKFLAPYSVPIVGLVAVIGGVVGVKIYRRYSIFHPTFDALRFDFEILAQRITYIYHGDGTAEYRRMKKLRALRNDLKTYPDKYHWTGATPPISIASANSNQSIRQTGRQTVWNHYEVEFHRTLMKGDEIETEVVWELDDRSQSSVPFVSATVEEPTRELSFELSFDASLGISEVTCNVTSGIGAKNILSSTTSEVSRTGGVTWRPPAPHPKLLHHYELEWQFHNRPQR